MIFVMFRCCIVAVTLFLFSFFTLSPLCYGAKLIWDSNTGLNYAGYKVYYGTSSENYDNVVNVGNVTEYNLGFLNRETTYYIAVTAYDWLGNESSYSVEVTYTVNDGVPDNEDNCPETPNGPDFGSCTQVVNGLVITSGVACINENGCKYYEDCQMGQEDSDGNGTGDACECYSDLNDDMRVNIFDLAIIKNELPKSNCASGSCQADINRDGQIDIFDLSILKSEFNRICQSVL